MNEIRKISEFVIQEIRNDISNKIGFDFRAKVDCFKISDLINQQVGTKVSGSTLYRLFIHKNKHVPYVYTLDAIAKFLSFKNWAQAYNHYQNREVQLLKMGVTIKGDLNKSLIYQNIVHSAHKPLFGFFEGISTESYDIKESVTFSLFDALLKVKNTKPFFKQFAGHPFVREYFFEIGADPTFSITDYDFGLNCYLNASESLDSEIGLRDFVFANCMLFIHSFESKDFKSAMKYGHKLYLDFASFRNRIEHIHVFPKFRYLTYYLTYLNLQGASKSEKEAYAYQLLQEAERYVNHPDYITRSIVFYQIGEALLVNQCKLELQQLLCELFYSDIIKLPMQVTKQPLKKILPYMQPNGILRHNPYFLS